MNLAFFGGNQQKRDATKTKLNKIEVSEPGVLMYRNQKYPPILESLSRIPARKPPHPPGISTSIRLFYVFKTKNRILVLIPGGCGGFRTSIRDRDSKMGGYFWLRYIKTPGSETSILFNFVLVASRFCWFPPKKA